MKNWIIWAIVIVAVLAGIWFLVGRPAQQTTMPAMQHEGMTMTMEGEALDMVECAVTGEKIHKGMAAATMEYKGKTYYFCCPDCIGKFKQNPEKYAK